MSCQEALEKLYRILDKEGTEVDEQFIRDHMEKCPPCCESFRMEKAFQEFLDARCCNPELKSEKLENLKSSLCEKLDMIDCDGVEKTTSSSAIVEAVPAKKSNNILAASMVMAASILFVFGIASIGNLFDYHYVNYSNIENAHFAAEDNQGQFVTRASFVSQRARDDFKYSIDESVQGYGLVGGIMMEFNGIEITHFLYTKDNSNVSVFIAPKGKIEIPSDILDGGEVTDKVGKFFEHRCHGCVVVYHETENSIVITATRDLNVELLEFVPGQSVI